MKEKKFTDLFEIYEKKLFLQKVSENEEKEDYISVKSNQS